MKCRTNFSGLISFFFYFFSLFSYPHPVAKILPSVPISREVLSFSWQSLLEKSLELEA